MPDTDEKKPLEGASETVQVSGERKPITSEDAQKIIAASMEHKGELRRYMSSQFELSPKSLSLRLK